MKTEFYVSWHKLFYLNKIFAACLFAVRSANGGQVQAYFLYLPKMYYLGLTPILALF